MLAAATAHMDAEFVGERSQAALEGADDAGGDAGRMPVHAHDGAERLEPERMRQPLQEFVAAIMVDDRLSDDGAERRHAGRKPRREASAVQRQVGASGSSCHSLLRLQSRWKIADVRARLVTTPRNGVSPSVISAVTLALTL